jgi:hypothetical protein
MVHGLSSAWSSERRGVRPRSGQPLFFSGRSEEENRLLRIALPSRTVGCFLLTSRVQC